MTKADERTHGAATKMPEHVPRYEHQCPTHKRWETCGIAASLVDPNDPKAEHGCAADVSVPIFVGTLVREVTAL